MELHDYLRILRKNWGLISLMTVLGLVVAGAYSVLATPMYESKTQIYVSVRTENAGVSDLTQGTSYARQIVTSYVDVVTTSVVLDPVVEELALPETAAELAGQITATAPSDTVLINITVSDADPQRAADIANAVGESLKDVVQEDLEPTDGTTSPIRLTTTQQALAAADPVSPNLKLNLALGLLVGLALGVGAAVLRDVLDTRVHSTQDIESLTEAPVIGGIPFDPDTKTRALIMQEEPRSPLAEPYRTLRTNLGTVR